jgi:multidrug/hemolysin transport system ATP-binding protein
MITVSDVSLSFGGQMLFKDVNLLFTAGNCYGVIGANGAGKSTTISIMCGQIKKDSGKIVICGKDTEKNFNSISSDIGVVFQNSVLDKALSVKDNLRSRAALYGITGKEFKNRLNR